jgi:hypothetical protein
LKILSTIDYETTMGIPMVGIPEIPRKTVEKWSKNGRGLHNMENPRNSGQVASHAHMA